MLIKKSVAPRDKGLKESTPKKPPKKPVQSIPVKKVSVDETPQKQREVIGADSSSSNISTPPSSKYSSELIEDVINYLEVGESIVVILVDKS